MLESGCSSGTWLNSHMDSRTEKTAVTCTRPPADVHTRARAHTDTHTVSVAFKKYAGFVTNKTEETETSCHFLLEWIIGFINAYKFIVGTKTADIQIVLLFYNLSA